MNLRAAINRTLYRMLLPLRRRQLRNTSVSIISNDCFSSFMYRFYGIPFNSPFAGLFVMPDDYLALLEHPEVMTQSMTMTDSTHSRYAPQLDVAAKGYPLGILPGGIEIHFLHYGSADEALEKWTRRTRRIDWNNCIVKFSQNNGCTLGHIRRFDALPYAHKVCFTTDPHPELPSVVPIPEFAGDAQLGKYWKNADLHYNFAAHANFIKKID